MYLNTNMLSALPAPLDSEGKGDMLLTLMMADDLRSGASRPRETTSRIALSDLAGETLAHGERLGPVVAKQFFLDGGVQNMPPAKGTENHIEVRINNIPLSPPRTEQGWIVFDVRPEHLALGDNLVGIRALETRSDVVKLRAPPISGWAATMIVRPENF